MRMPLCFLLTALGAMLSLLLTACPGGAGKAPVSTRNAGGTHAAGDQQPAAAAARARLAFVLGSSENDPWTAALLAAVGSSVNQDLLASPAPAKPGLDCFGPYDCRLDDKEISLSLALCELSNVAELGAQEKLGELVREWIESEDPDLVWLDGDQLQFTCGSKLDPALPVVFTGVEVRSDAYYAEGRAVCGVMRQHSLARAMGEVFKVLPEAKQVALVSDDAPLGLARIKTVRELEQAMPYGVNFVTQEPVASWAGLSKLLGQMDKGIDAVLIVGVGGDGGSLAAQARHAPAELHAARRIPVIVYGPSAIDSSGVLSLRVKPAAHAREALRLCAEILAGKAAAPLGIKIPDDMELYRSER